MAILEIIALFTTQNLFLFWIIAFIGTSLLGDATYITFTIISVHFNIPLWIIFSAAYLGTILGDTIWYVAGVKAITFLKKKNLINRKYKKIEENIEKVFGKHSLRALIITKFLYGTRVLAVVYVANKKIGYLKFLYYDLIATFFWVVAFGLVGWFAGIGLSFVINTFKNIQLTLSIIVLIIIIFNILEKKITKIFEK